MYFHMYYLIRSLYFSMPVAREITSITFFTVRQHKMFMLSPYSLIIFSLLSLLALT